LIDFAKAKIFSKEEEKTTKKKKKVLFIAGRGKNARLFRLFLKKS
jgi:DNA topoisomerase VI subunit A